MHYEWKLANNTFTPLSGFKCLQSGMFDLNISDFWMPVTLHIDSKATVFINNYFMHLK